MLPISVVIPFFNSSKTVIRSLDSIIKQTNSPSEIIIINDCSNDIESNKLDKILEDLKTNIPVILIKSTINNGAGKSRNIGVEKSKYDYIAFLDSDDIWHPKKLEIQYEQMLINDWDMSGHKYIFNFNKQKWSDLDFVVYILNKHQFIYKNPYFTPTVMVRKDGFINFDPRFRLVDDYKCWVSNYKEGKMGFITSYLASGFKSPIGQAGLTSSISRMSLSYIKVLLSLLQEKKISFIFFSFAIMIEFLKLPLRYLKVFFKC